MLYVEFRANVSGATKWMSYDVYDDPDFLNSINYDFRELAFSTGPYRYAQIVPSLDAGVGNSIWEQYYTYLEMPLEGNSTIYITDQNGTIVEIKRDFDGTVTDIEDNIDEDVIGYPNPEDPNPPGWEDTGYLTAHRFKFILFGIGMILCLGTLMFGFYARPEAATWIIIFFCMFCGVSLLWALQTM